MLMLLFRSVLSEQNAVLIHVTMAISKNEANIKRYFFVPQVFL